MARQAEACASSEHDVVCDGEQDYPKSIGHVRFAVQQFGPGEECWVECCPCMELGHQNPTPQGKKELETYMITHSQKQPKRIGALLQQQRCGTLEGKQ